MRTAPCAVGMVLAVVGVLQCRHGRRLAAHGLWMNLAIAAGPAALVWLIAQR